MIDFPRTPHLAWLGPRGPRADKLLSPQEVAEFLAGEIVVEEKVDGANLGIAATEQGGLIAWNRGSPIPSHGAQPQFRPLRSWLTAREETLVRALKRDLALFGEWCHAVHSVHYDRLPDWFLLFDVYDGGLDRFWSTSRRDALARDLGLHTVPILDRGRFRLDALRGMLGKSRFADGPAEGLYLRREDPEWLTGRAKLVRAEFLEHITEHWSRRSLKRNRLACEWAGKAKEVSR